MEPNCESPTGCSQHLQQCQNCSRRQVEEDERKWQSTNEALQAALDDSRKTNTIVVGKLQHMEGRLEATMIQNMILKNNPEVVAGENEKLHTTVEELKECRAKLKEAHDQIAKISARLNSVEQQNHFTRCMEKMMLAQQWGLKDREVCLLRTSLHSLTQQRARLMTEHMKEKSGFLASIQELKRKATEKRPTEKTTHERDMVGRELQALAQVCSQLKTERAAEKSTFLAEIRDLKLKATEWTLHKQRLEKELERVKPLELERIRMVLELNELKLSLQSLAEDHERLKANVAAEIHQLTKELSRQNQMKSSLVIVQERERMIGALNVVVARIEERKSAFSEAEIQELKRKAKVCTCAQKDGRLTNEQSSISPTVVPTQIEELRKEATMDAHHEECAVSPNLAGLASAIDTPDLDVGIEVDSSSDDDSIITQPETLICSAEGWRQRTSLVDVELRTPSSINEKHGEENRTADSSDLSSRVAKGLLTPQVSFGTLEECGDNNKRKVKGVPWWENFRRLKRFKMKHGHLEVTNDDNLVSWITEQRAQLHDDGCRLRVLSLSNIGFEWGKGHPFSLRNT